MLIGLALVLGITSCGLLTTEAIPLFIDIVATPTSVAVGDTVTMVVTVTGSGLNALYMNYADGTGASVTVVGATAGKATFAKRYTATGLFPVIGTVVDQFGAQKADTVVVTVH